MPGPGVVLWASGREGLAQGLCPESLAAVHPAWREDALRFGPWQALSTPWCGDCGSDGWWVSQADAGSLASRVVVCGPCTSVMDVVRPLGEAGGLAPWDCVLAVSQHQGRGQLRRTWESPPGNLYACVVLPPAPPEYDSLVPLILGDCLVRFFGEQGLAMRLKWPNDLISHGVKVGGILVEERKGVVTAGIGINLCQCPPAEALRQGHAVPAGHLGGAFTPLGLWCSLVNYFRICYEVALHRGVPQATAAGIETNLAWLGEVVMVREGGSEPYRALPVGLTPEGALRLRSMDGSGVERILTSGSIWPV